VCEPARERLVGIFRETLETTMLQVFQETTSEEGGVVSTDPEELALLEFAPTLGDHNTSIVDCNPTVHDIEARKCLLDRGFDEIGVIDKLNFHDIVELLGESRETLSYSLGCRSESVSMRVEEQIDITEGCLSGDGPEVGTTRAVEKQVPREPTADPASYLQRGFDGGDARENMIEILTRSGAECFLMGIDFIPHDQFRPRMRAITRPTTMAMIARNQNFRMTASLCY